MSNRMLYLVIKLLKFYLDKIENVYSRLKIFKTEKSQNFNLILAVFVFYCINICCNL